MRKPRGLFAKRLGLTGIQDIDSVLDLISPADFRSDGQGGSGELPAARLATVCGGGVAGVGQNGRPGLDFERG